MRGISWLAANQLAAQEELQTMEWVSKYVSKNSIFGYWDEGRQIKKNWKRVHVY